MSFFKTGTFAEPKPTTTISIALREILCQEVSLSYDAVSDYLYVATITPAKDINGNPSLYINMFANYSRRVLTDEESFEYFDKSNHLQSLDPIILLTDECGLVRRYGKYKQKLIEGYN